MVVDPFSAGILGASMGFDILGGISQGKKQDRLFKQFKRSVAKREAEQVDLERIARGEFQVSLAESKHLFSNTIAAISAVDSVASRRLMEDIARREAVSEVRGRQRGLLGSTATAGESLARERETFRAALDAGASRSSRMAEVMQAELGFNANVRGQIAGSFRREGQIRAEAGRSMQRAFENTEVRQSAITPGVGQLLGQLGLLSPGGSPQGGELSLGGKAAIRSNPFIGADFF